MIQDAWFSVTELSKDTFAISEYGHWEKVHSFLLIGDEKAALIDTGLGIKDIKKMVTQLTDKPIIVITTHVHTDHIGSHASFDKVAVHEADCHWLENGIQGLSIEQIRYDLCRDLTKPLPKDFDVDSFFPYQGKPTIVLKDNDIISLGNRTLKIIHTPGHSPGHICVLDETNNFLFTGDLIYLETPIYAFYPSTSPKDLLNSIIKISELKQVERVFGSHNTLNIESSILSEGREAALFLQKNKLDDFGTGIHTFNHLSFKF